MTVYLRLVITMDGSRLVDDVNCTATETFSSVRWLSATMTVPGNRISKTHRFTYGHATTSRTDQRTSAALKRPTHTLEVKAYNIVSKR